MTNPTSPATVDAAKARASQPKNMAPTFQRLQMALVAASAIWRGNACLSKVGARYFGIEWTPPRKISHPNSYQAGVDLVENL